MIKFKKLIKIVLLFICCSQVGFSQYYDVGYSTNYLGIYEFKSSEKNFKEKILKIDPIKTIKRVFDADGILVEELIFINGELVSGVEYFINPSFPFLKVPRDFKMEHIRHKISRYSKIKFTSSLTSYIPKDEEHLFRVRVYNNKGQDFFILNKFETPKLYYK